uniref:Calcium load-activated calcium channel n=1 Tax=Colobus angolensis palliatus TaxID=336983 RepID=A0A2K5IML2_COLAP
MSTMFADTLLIVFISVCTALLAEGITWVLVYRTDKYKRLKAEVEKQSKKLEKKKETITESAGRQQKKKIERQEEKLKNNNRDLSMVRMKSMFAIGFCFTALMGMFNSIFDGRVVAKLPFTPLSYIQGLSHRNLLGDDTTDCSFIFLYILCTITFRRFSALPLHELPPSRQVDFLAHHLLLGSSPELKQNSLFSIILSRHTHIRLANVALLLGPLSSFELFLGLLGMIRVKMAPSKLDSAFGPR